MRILKEKEHLHNKSTFGQNKIRGTFRNLLWCLFVSVGMFAISGCSSIMPLPTTPEKFTMITRTNSIDMKLVYLPGGTFRMGDSNPYLDAQPVHTVTVSGFWIGQYEVTNKQFDLFKKRDRPAFSLLDDQPATEVNWYEAVEFCKWLSKKEGNHYRLPTNAEWEYAARGGLDQKMYPWGDDADHIEERTTWRERVDSPIGKTKPVGSFPPNDFGLYDMAGNVEEWVQDWYQEDYYAHSPKVNPQGPKTGTHKIAAGGNFTNWDQFCAARAVSAPQLAIEGSGFRVVMEKKPPTELEDRH